MNTRVRSTIRPADQAWRLQDMRRREGCMRSYTFSEAPNAGGLNSRLIATMRLVLSSSVLFIIVPTDLEELGAFHILTTLYATYSALLYGFARRLIRSVLAKMMYLADISWAVLLV